MIALDRIKDANSKRVVNGIIGTVIVGALAACASNEGRFSVKNSATEAIVTASVVICGQTERFEKIDILQTRAAKYRVTGDSGYHVKVAFQSGRTLERDVGYVTNDLNFDDELIITDNNIEIVSKNRH